MAIMPFTLAIDFEGDQWTFFKPPHDELRDLYGIDVQELNCWRPLIDHAEEHLAAGKLISTEADAWWLPDIAGTDYRRAAHEVDDRARRPRCRRAPARLLSQRRLLHARRRGLRADVPAGSRAGSGVHAVLRRARAGRSQGRPARRTICRAVSALLRAISRGGGRQSRRKFAARFARDLPELRRRGSRIITRGRSRPCASSARRRS